MNGGGGTYPGDPGGGGNANAGADSSSENMTFRIIQAAIDHLPLQASNLSRVTAFAEAF